MIHIITLSNPQAADLFVNYMTTKGVRIHTKNENQQISLWLEDQHQLDMVEKELNTFLREPFHPRYQAASWQTGDPKNTGIKYRPAFSIKNMVQRSGPLTVLVVILCILIFIWQQVVGDYNVMLHLAWPYKESLNFEVWRYITPAFVHFSLMHIAFNLAMWWYLASQTEQRLGTGKLFVIMLVSALFSNWAQSLFTDSNFGGLSGVVYALIGYVGLTGIRNPEKGIGVPTGLIGFSILWIVAGYMGVLGDSIGNTAHFAGFLIGLLMALWDNRHQLSRRS
ncbi:MULTISPECIES: rhomboid family intramembrane serine protease GlpG [Proteus]|uniref:rhomboid family intramembrane serine protease GlpG n=1 Tax=Proteus TaxID=583 RepID=UPI000D693116|nr:MULTISPECIES: rhomboid family intramembrane serine protease GlpG [Proteus]MBG5951020.1 rhomboid family intramembrane serine protease GlpG [Proteus terrae]MCE9838186.1 rhomboid family intramembrane serine protease GlpG [Proteus terrae]NBN70365.1 rhomboid family intramembrane serine protease GlpG [Proteus sp. G2618]